MYIYPVATEAASTQEIYDAIAALDDIRGDARHLSGTMNGASRLLLKAHRILGETRCRVYDWRHAVQTCGDVALSDLRVVGESVEHGAPYAPSHPTFLIKILRQLRIDYSRYEFVDLGSGKGRVLLVASEFPFRRITGVEFASELHEIAVQNVKNYRSTSQRCRDIQCVNGDAMQYVFPDAPTVLFMFNPFRPAVLVPILRRLQASLEQNPRDVLLLYAAPFYGDLVEQETMLRCIARERYHNSYGLPRAQGAIGGSAS